jgi:aquaporin Z
MEPSSQSDNAARATHEIADGILMNNFVESKIIRKESLRSATRESGATPLNAVASLLCHWPEYLMEAGELGLYMLLVCTFTTLLQYPTSPVRHFVPSAVVRRAIMGLLVGPTVVAIIMTPWGKQSGGHFNPAITLTFYRLGKVAFWDTLFYVAAQLSGAAGGVAIAAYVLRDATGNAAVRYAVTAPGIFGNAGTFVGEVSISFILMTAILFASNRKLLARYTPYVVGALYATFITFETPLSGMSMNPARTFGSAFCAGYWQAMWIYFIAPTMGMFAGAEIFLWVRGGIPPYCAKLHHDNDKRCIFQHGRWAARVQDSHF